MPGCREADPAAQASSETVEEAAAPQPNLVLITLDTTRADHLGSYGHARPTSPHLDRLAEQGVRFDVAYSAAASTAPSHATLFTGQHPPAHGLVKNGLGLRAGGGMPTLARRLQDAGYDTAGIVSSFVLHRSFGFADGFAHYDDSFIPAEATQLESEWQEREVPGRVFDRRAGAATHRARRWLNRKRDRSKPFFLFVHYFDPHLQHVAPEPYQSRMLEGREAPLPERKAGKPIDPETFDLDYTLRSYDAEIAYTDDAVRALLDSLERQGLVQDTLVVVTADHGEGLMSHGVLSHAIDLHEEAVRVPWLMRWPGVLRAGQVVRAPVGAVDLHATMLGLLGVPVSRLPGRDVSAALRAGREPAASTPVFFYRRLYERPTRLGWLRHFLLQGTQEGVRLGRWKLVEVSHGEDLLFDLDADPDERINRIGEEPERVAGLRALLAKRRAADAEWGGEERVEAALDDEQRAALEALGYVE